MAKAVDIDDVALIQAISADLADPQATSVLFERIVDSAMAIMRSDLASMQILEPSPDGRGMLRLVAFRGFDRRAARFWQLIPFDATTTCAAALRARQRVVVKDVAQWDVVAGTPNLVMFLQSGIHAIQSTPLVSRMGPITGMISTHWHRRHEPTSRQLRLMDILARQAADLIDRGRYDREHADILDREHHATAAAEAANRLKDEFLATVSHELRTPLNAIVGWTAMLERMDPTDPRLQKGLQSIGRNTRALARMVDDVLDVSRIISGKMRLDMALVDVSEVINAAIEAVLPAATAKDIVVSVAPAPRAHAIMADPTRLQQVIWNLLSNAIKFTPRRGRVKIETHACGSEIEIRIQDTGIGIDPAFLPYVFDRFRQADASTTRAHTGLGLGLAIVRHLVDLHGGRIRAESAGRHMGATFVVAFPACDAPPTVTRVAAMPVAVPALAPIIAALPQRLDHLRVLVVDNDRESCEVMAEILRVYGADVVTSMSATEAAAALRASRPGIVLTDIGMPERDGFSVLRDALVFRRESGAPMPIVAVTAYARAEDRQRALDAGFDAYLAKPVDPGALIVTLSTLTRTTAG